MNKLISVLLIPLIFLLFSCAGFKPGVSSDDALGVMEDLNGGNTEKLIDSTSLPFVFDREILESETQIRSLWSGLVNAGYIIDDPVIVMKRPVLISDGSLFSASWEIETFFKNVLKDDDVLVQVEGQSQKIFMVLRPGKKGGTVIKAWKGEVIQ